MIIQYLDGSRALSVPYDIWLNKWLPAKQVAYTIALLFALLSLPCTSTSKKASLSVSPLCNLKLPKEYLNVSCYQGNSSLASALPTRNGFKLAILARDMPFILKSIKSLLSTYFILLFNFMYNGFNHGNTSKLLSGQLTIDTLLHTPIFSFLLPVSVSARHRDPNIALEQRAKFPPQYCGVLIRKTSALSITIKTCLSSLFQPVFCHVEN